MHLLLHYVKGVLKLLTGRFTVNNKNEYFTENSEQVIYILINISYNSAETYIDGRLAKGGLEFLSPAKFC